MNLKETLDEYNSLIDTYKSLDWDSATEISSLLKDLSCVLAYLEGFRTEYYHKWIAISSQENTVSAGERKADIEVPELYMLRRIMTAGYKVLDAMRSNISYAKKEQ